MWLRGRFCWETRLTGSLKRPAKGFCPEWAPRLKEGGSRQSHGVVLEGLRKADHPIQIEAVTMFRHPAGSWSPSIDGIWSQRPYVGDWVRIRQPVIAGVEESD